MAKQEYISSGSDQVFNASTQAGVALSTALSTTQTGFTLTNPFNSGYNLILLAVTVMPTTAPAGISTILLTANTNPSATAVTQTTPLTVRNAKLGSGANAVGLAASAVTLPAAPVVIGAIGGVSATGSTTPVPVQWTIDGLFVIVPGCAVSVNCLTTAISAVVSMNWAEVGAF